MTKIRTKKLLFVVLSVLMFVCLFFGIMGQSSKIANADTITPVGVADTNFRIVGGTYGRTDAEATSPDGIDFHIVPTNAGADVTLTLMGAHRKYLGNFHNNGAAGDWWSGRMRLGNTTEIEARVTTLRSPVNQNYEISFISTSKGIYISLTSDIVMKDGVPYINGSNVALSPVQTGDNLANGVIDFRPTTNAGVVGTSANCTPRTTQMFKLGGGTVFSDCVLTDKATLDAFLISVPEKYKERYTTEWVNTLCKDLGANDDLLEFRFIGVPATGTTLTIYELNGKVYDKNVENTAGTKYTTFQAPRPILVQKDSYTVFQEGAVNMNDLLEKWCPVNGITAPTLLDNAYHTYDTYNCEWIDVTSDKREYINTATAQTGQGDCVFDPTNTYNADGTAYFVLKDTTPNGTTEGQYGTYYFFARWNIVERTDEIITAKTDTLKWGQEYRLDEIFAVNQSVADMRESDVSLKGYLNDTTATGTENVLGTLTEGTFKVMDYNTNTSQYSVYIIAYGDAVDSRIGYAVYNFTIDENLPSIAYTGLPLIVGVECDLGVLFTFGGAELTSYSYKVNEVAVPNGKYQAIDTTTCTVFCEVTDSRGKKASTTISIEVMSIGLVSEINKEIEKETTEFFADPALPYEGVSYTTELYRATDDVATATPLTISSNYVFSESGAYKLLYVINVDSIQQVITYTTTYNVTMVEQKPNIQIAGEIAEVYYTGNVLTIPSATATNSYTTYNVDVEVKSNGSSVAIQDGKVKFADAGEYEIIYSASYGGEQPVKKVVEVSVLQDNTSPEIYVYGTYATHYDAGLTIAVLSATVIDDSNANITPTVKITKGGQEISAQDGRIVLENGTYSIIYTATDDAGHTTEQKFDFTAGTGVDGTNSGNGENSGCGGCNGSVGGTMLPIMMVLVPFVVIVARRKEEHYD